MALSFFLLVLVVASYFTYAHRRLIRSKRDLLYQQQFTEPLKPIKPAILTNIQDKKFIRTGITIDTIKQALANLRPSNRVIGCTGCYTIVVTLLECINARMTTYWDILQVFAATSFMAYAIGSNKSVSSWIISLFWTLLIIFCLPLNLIWHWFHLKDAQFALTLSVSHLSAALFVLPLYISIQLVVVTLLVILYAIWTIETTQFSILNESLLSLVGFGLIVFTIIIYNKRKVTSYIIYNRHLKNETLAEPNQSYSTDNNHGTLDAKIGSDKTKEDTSSVEKAMKEATELISYIDNKPLYTQDIQSIINNFVVFSAFLKQRARSSDHILLTPNEITIDDLITKLEAALEVKVATSPKMIIERKDNGVPKTITCDISHMMQSLVPIVLRTANLTSAKSEVVKIQLHTTQLKCLQNNGQKGSSELDFPAIALVVSSINTPSAILPQIRTYYEDLTEGRELKWHSSQTDSDRIRLEKRVIERAVRAHYGYLRFPISKKRPMLIVLPTNVAQVRDAMIDKILPLNVPITQKEIDQSMEMFIKSYNHLCEISEVRKAVIDEVILLIRRCYGFRKHLSGQLFYIRAIGITQLVAEWVRFYPEPIYVALLYDLVHHADLPLSYIKANYDLNIYSFIESVLAINDRQGMEPCGLYIGNALKQVINREQLFVLCIKLAERLYDLRHAKSYTHLDELRCMAHETLAVDIELAKKYLNTKIVAALANAAEEALQVCEKK